MAEKALCTIPGCGKPARMRGVCNTHYYRHWRGDKSIKLAPKRIPNSKLICKAPECNRPAFNLGYCSMHYQRLYKTGKLDCRNAPAGAAVAFCQQAAKSDTTECIIWPFKLKEGYGFVRPPTPGVKRSRQMKASRYVCMLAHGPSNGLHALHTCHDARCVNPAHLYWGTNDRNIQDKLEAGRQSRGSAINCCILTEEQAREIKYMDISGYKSMLAAARDLGPKYGVSMYTIKNIWVGTAWKYV